MVDTKDYRSNGKIATMCSKYKIMGSYAKPKDDTVECEHEKFDRYHRNICKYFDSNSLMCRYGNK